MLSDSLAENEGKRFTVRENDAQSRGEKTFPKNFRYSTAMLSGARTIKRTM